MPFRTTNVPPLMHPRVTVEFAGQMLLEAGVDDTDTSRTCEVGVNRYVSTHTLNVILIVIRPDKPPTLIPLLKGHLTSPFTIRLDPDPGDGDFKVFAPTADPFIRTAAAGNDDLDYRWAVNIRSIHPTARRTEGAEPVAKLRTGVLYTPTLTRPGLDPRFEREGLPPIPLFRVAAELAASIVPPADKKVRCEWRDLGDPFSLTLPRDADPAGTIYTISFLNDPPLSAPLHDELALYYRVLQAGGFPIDLADRFAMKYTSAIRTDEIPCWPGTLYP